LDTNAIGDLLRGNEALTKLLTNAEWVGCSVINVIEYKAIKDLPPEDQNLFYQFINRVEVVNLDHKEGLLINLICDIRKKYPIKTPDAIIAASAILNDATLVTADKEIRNIKNLEVISQKDL
jgi:predicted nucleic acid-binding protein